MSWLLFPQKQQLLWLHVKIPSPQIVPIKTYVLCWTWSHWADFLSHATTILIQMVVTYTKLNKDFQRHLNTCLRKWKLLSLYMFHRIIFLLLIVSSLFCNFNRCAVCFQSLMNIACRSSQNTTRIKRLSKVRTGQSYRWFWKFC